MAAKPFRMSAECVADVLTYLSWQEPIRGTIPQVELKGHIDNGRSIILSRLAECLRDDEEVAHA